MILFISNFRDNNEFVPTLPLVAQGQSPHGDTWNPASMKLDTCTPALFQIQPEHLPILSHSFDSLKNRYNYLYFNLI